MQYDSGFRHELIMSRDLVKACANLLPTNWLVVLYCISSGIVYHPDSLLLSCLVQFDCNDMKN